MGKRNILGILSRSHRAGEIFNAIKCTKQWFTLTLNYLELKTPNFPFIFETRKGFKIEINTFHDLITVWIIFCRHEYKIPEGTQVVIDAGANIGSFSIYACAHNVAEVYALEPFPETFAMLQKNIKTNNLSEKVQLNAVALANETGSRNMDIHDGPSQSRGLLEGDDPSGLAVKTSTLADFIDSTGKKEIDFLKIDIEGGEHEVFQSSSYETLQKIKNMAMEYHPGAPKKDLFQKIVSANFKLIHDYQISETSGVAYFQRL